MTNRTDKQTSIDKQDIFFSDFLTNFNKHPSTGALVRVTNVNAVKQALRNIVLTNFGERLYQPIIGGNVNAALFEPMDGFSTDYLQNSIKSTIFNNERRVKSIKVTATPNFALNKYDITIQFTIQNSPTIETVDLILVRNR